MFRVPMIARSALALAAVCSSLSCDGGPTGPSTSLTGVWGGDHIALTVTDAGGHAEFDCAHGEISGALATDARRTFRGSGTFVREHGGPIRVDDPIDSHPAIYFGSATDRTMELTVQLTDTNIVVGTFTLARAAQGRVVKCLLPVTLLAVP